VVGLMPSVEFTPVFSLTDCASADVEISNAAAVIVSAVLFMSRVLAFVTSRDFGRITVTRQPGQGMWVPKQARLVSSGL
jgi:hypothetical protein